MGSDTGGTLDASEPDLGLSHVDGAGRARMVDVTSKPVTLRRAVARCRVAAPRATIRWAAGGSRGEGGPGADLAWTDVLGAARLAGIQAAKRTSELVPLCHPLTISNVDVRFSMSDGGIEVEGEAEVVGQTGVEMEAMTACAFAALSIVFALERSGHDGSVEALELWEKRGGRSGTWVRPVVG